MEPPRAAQPRGKGSGINKVFNAVYM
jgi:hypothetical protein